MLLVTFICAALLADVAEVTARERDADLAAYETLRAKVGRDAQAHLNLALWCEAHRLGAERLRHLALAVLIDPKNVTARGLMGLMEYRTRWESPERVGERIKADEVQNAPRAEYRARREELAGRFADRGGKNGRRSREEAAAHLALGQWCEKNGLAAEATAHFTSAVVSNPHDATAWRKLGYLKRDGRWMSPEQVAAEERETAAQTRATRHWEPLLKKWRGWLGGENDAKQEEASTLLAGVADPYAVPAVMRVFRDGKEAHERLAAQLLGQIAGPAATRALAILAVRGATPGSRLAARQVLRNRPPRDFVRTLVDQIHAPMRYRVEPVRGPGSPGAIVIETPRYKVLRTYDAPPVALIPPNFHGYVGYDPNGMPIVAQPGELRGISPTEWNVPGFHPRFFEAEQHTQTMIAAANVKATASLQNLVNDVNMIEQSNAEVNAWNERVASALQSAVENPPTLDQGDEDGWHRWAYDQMGYRYDPPTQVQLVVNASPQDAAPQLGTTWSCFVAGTPVRTLDGLRPIETLQVGDQVLSQDTTTGALTFQMIQVVHHNPPSPTVELAFENGESLVPSVYHRFWRAGQGWTMARDLKPGDVLRTLDGLARLISIAPGPVAPVYNLDVAETRSFFVGVHGALVHDNRLPAGRVQPFDAALMPDSTSASATERH